MIPTNNSINLNGSRRTSALSRATTATRTPEAALQEAKQSLANGQMTAQMMADMEAALYTPQELFGPNTMYQVEFIIPGAANTASHNHFIYIPEEGPAQILTGHAHPSGQLYVEHGDLLDSSHQPGQMGGDTHQVQQVPLTDPAAAWESMTATADDINAAGLYYNALGQNSNSVAATVADVGGFTMGDPSGNGDGAINFLGMAGGAIGADNNLLGEINGTETPIDQVLMSGHPLNSRPDLTDPASGSPLSQSLAEPEPETPIKPVGTTSPASLFGPIIEFLEQSDILPLVKPTIPVCTGDPIIPAELIEKPTIPMWLGDPIKRAELIEKPTIPMWLGDPIKRAELIKKPTIPMWLGDPIKPAELIKNPTIPVCGQEIQ